MPSKAKKAASRQANLRNRRKRRDRGRPQDFVLTPSETSQEDNEVLQDSGAAEENQTSTRQSATAVAPAPRSRPRGVRRTQQQRAAAEAPASVYQHLGREVRQIGIISSLIVAILVVLTFVLR